MRERQERRHLPVLGSVHTCTIGRTEALRGAWSVVNAELKPTGHMPTTAMTFAVALGTHVARLRELRQNVMWLRLSLATQHYQHRKISCARASVLDSQMLLLLLVLLQFVTRTDHVSRCRCISICISIEGNLTHSNGTLPMALCSLTSVASQDHRGHVSLLGARAPNMLYCVGR